uniref:Uncharacterized protein n=1 Tax=Timema genevievae TaxID=629358 RepID=A0A7R9KAB6_TIMGE|nr:unnamed protein product [Timema genevievae]
MSMDQKLACVARCLWNKCVVCWEVEVAWSMPTGVGYFLRCMDVNGAYSRHVALRCIQQRYELSVGYVRTYSVNGGGETCEEGSECSAGQTQECKWVVRERLAGVDPLSPRRRIWSEVLWQGLHIYMGFVGSRFGVRGRELVSGLCTVNHGPHQRYAFTGCITRSRTGGTQERPTIGTPLRIPCGVYGYAQDSQRP